MPEESPRRQLRQRSRTTCNACGVQIKGKLASHKCRSFANATTMPTVWDLLKELGPDNWGNVWAWIVGIAVFIGVAYLLGSWIMSLGEPGAYTFDDCIRQWHDVGVYARAEEYCAEYR